MFNTIDIVPSSIRDDPQVQAICYAIDQELASIYECIPSICFVPNIMSQVPPLLDILAWQYHVDVWQGWSGELDVDTKRELVLQSFVWHGKKGTKWAVNQMLQTVFKQGRVTEWYEYGGKPYFFRIVTEDDIVDVTQLKQVIAAIYAVKNERSWLDSFVRVRQQGSTWYLGMATCQFVTTIIKMAK